MIRLSSLSLYIQSCYLVFLWYVFIPKGTCTGVWVLSDLSPFALWGGEGVLPISLTWDPPPCSPLHCLPPLLCAWFSLPMVTQASVEPLVTAQSLFWQSRLVLSKLVCHPVCSVWPGQWKGLRNTCSLSLPSSSRMCRRTNWWWSLEQHVEHPDKGGWEGHVLLCAGVTAGDRAQVH